jgi:hypothetical protein
MAILPPGMAPRTTVAATDHLVISEVITGGASASDELIELYNPSAAALPLEGLELVYVTASGTTVTQRASWGLGAPSVAAGAHLLVANELGIFAPIADALFASGMAAAGGSVALRIKGAATAIDAAGWGTAASAWMEGSAAPAPPAGSSIERLPGGAAGSTTDTDDNATDFAVRAMPDPQNAASPLVPATPAATQSPSEAPSPSAPTPTRSPTPAVTATPSAMPSASPSAAPSATATPAPSPTATPTVTPTATPISVASARAAPDGSTVTIEAGALTASAFSDGGGYVSDGSAGIAVLLDGGSFARNDRVLVSGTVDDRFAQRTLRAEGVTVSPGSAPMAPIPRATGAIDESVECRLVAVSGAVDGSPTALTGALAFDVDDGSGVARVIVGVETGIDTSGWTDGRRVSVTGLVGQRDSSGTGTSGYRVLPRDPADVELLPPASPSPSPGPSTGLDPSPSPAPTGAPGTLSTIAAARAAARNAQLTVRGVVTLASDTIEPGSAVIQDASGAILLRLGGEAGSLELGELVEVDGVRSTKSGMESLRVSAAPRRLGAAPDHGALQVRSGEAGEAQEARVVVARGGLVASARRASSGSVSFDLDDGSGQLHVVLGAPLAADDSALERGTWVEVVGVLGQETTGAEPLSGYRVWPRHAGEVRILAPATGAVADGGGGRAADGGEGLDDDGRFLAAGGSDAIASLDVIGSGPIEDLRVGATLVATEWQEAGLAGLLWDGRLLVGIAAASGDVLEAALAARTVPVALELGHLSAVGTDARFGIAVVALGSEATDIVVRPTTPTAPLVRVPESPDTAAWVSIIGRLAGDRLEVGGTGVQVEQLCANGRSPLTGTVSVTGVALPLPPRLVVPCEAVRPVPSLDLVLAVARAQRRGVDQVRAAPTALPGTWDDLARRGVAAGLLAAGIGALLLAALAGRRAAGNTADDAAAAPIDRGNPAVGGPGLTLLPRSDEHGP